MMVMVHHRHMKSAGVKFCNKGAREFAKRHGIDWREFITNGVPEEVLTATGDAMALRVVENARAEWAAAKR